MEGIQPATINVHSPRPSNPTLEINVSTIGRETRSSEASSPHPGLYLDYDKIENCRRKYPG